MEGLFRNLMEAKEELRSLRQALPRLPSPKRVYEMLVAQCQEFYRCTKKLSHLDSRIRALRRSQDNRDRKIQQLSLLEVTCEKARLEFLLVKSQLSTLFVARPLLFATGAVSRAVWDSWMDREHVNDDDDPFLMVSGAIESALSDQLQLLDGFRSNLQEFRAALEEEGKEQRASFEAEVRQAIQSLHNMVEEVLETIERHPSTQSTSSTSTQNEDDVIEENAEYMESVEEPQVDEGRDKEDTPEEEQQPPMEEKTADDFGAADQEAEEAPTVPTPSRDEERRRVNEELRRLRREHVRLTAIITDLMRQPTCLPRNFQHGSINREEERFMRCVFCNTVGNHYSDSCTVVRTIEDRRQSLHDTGRCERCLEFCMGNKGCPKYYTRCYHCRQLDHHSAICELPDQSEEIFGRLSRARNDQGRCVLRMIELQQQLNALSNED